MCSELQNYVQLGVTSELRATDSLLLGTMHTLLHWLTVNATLIAILVTAGVAVLLVCCLQCTKCPHRDKDDLFNRREV